MICRKIPLEIVDLCDANSVKKRENIAAFNGYPRYSGWLLDICSSRSEETIHTSHSDSKTGCFWNYSEGIIDHPCVGGERAGGRATRGQGRNPWQQWSLN